MKEHLGNMINYIFQCIFMGYVLILYIANMSFLNVIQETQNAKVHIK